MDKQQWLKDMSSVLNGLDRNELQEVDRTIRQAVSERRPRVDIETIRPGMNNEARSAAYAEVTRILSEGD